MARLQLLMDPLRLCWAERPGVSVKGLVCQALLP
jgi:hypothetical protein